MIKNYVKKFYYRRENAFNRERYIHYIFCYEFSFSASTLSDNCDSVQFFA